MPSLLRPPSAPAYKRFIFKDTIWLGGKHDGYPLVPFKEYTKIRFEVDTSTLCKCAAVRQSALTFGLLEAVIENKIPESALLPDDGSGRLVMTCENLSELLRDWRSHIRQLGNGDACRQWADRVQTSLKLAHGILMIEPMEHRFSLFREPFLTDAICGYISRLGQWARKHDR
ncbi:hypothetical protein K440DRAFT_135155 [Wilcoxina mikolae CBS 423.85]|nr:hypothetical protein K440DRAFT_135155 [Wilcoxina mikolae CBS 423.85]